MIDIQDIKQRFGIVGASHLVDRAITIALQVAPTDLSVLVTGESGVGKENFPKIIHQNSARKHGPYIAVNCGAIPEGTIDSELFGHEKGAFTGATEARKGYFEQSDGGTIFLDEVGELPLATQSRLLRVLESGEFLRVGSSKVLKTNVRVVAATNLNMIDAVAIGKFREDLYYRLNTVPIDVPPLRERKDDILLLFKKFAVDFSVKYHMPLVELTPEAERVLKNYAFPGNVRQLKNMVEQISIIESQRQVSVQILQKYIPVAHGTSSALQLVQSKQQATSGDVSFERELIFKFLADMQKDINELKKEMAHLLDKHVSGNIPVVPKPSSIVLDEAGTMTEIVHENPDAAIELAQYVEADEANTEERSGQENILDNQNDSLLLENKEKETIILALQRNKGKRRAAALDLGISERTLYRKLKDFNLD